MTWPEKEDCAAHDTTVGTSKMKKARPQESQQTRQIPVESICRAAKILLPRFADAEH